MCPSTHSTRIDLSLCELFTPCDCLFVVLDVFTNETQNVGRDDMARSRSSSSSTSTSKYMNPITPEEQTQQHIQTDTNLFVDSDGEESIIQYESANTADNHSLEDVVDEKLLDMSHTRHQRNPSKGKVSLGESITTSNSDMDKELPNLLDTPPQSSLNNNIINTQSNSNITNTNCSIKPVDIPSASTESQVPFSSTSDLTSTSTSTSVSTTPELIATSPFIFNACQLSSHE